MSHNQKQVDKINYVTAPYVAPPQKPRNGFFYFVDTFLRRFIDIFVSFLAILFLLPLFLIIAIAIKRDSPGPILFNGKRAGRNGKPFAIHKFRTMHERPESYQGSKVTANGDQRITPIGKWLRDTKLNELPQLWNILIGEMSLVGPRPEDFELAANWPEEIRKEILSVRPGLTSPASILYRNEESILEATNVLEDYLARIMPTKLRLDLLYVRNRTILTDFDVIFWTAIVLIPLARKTAIPQNMLYWGPLSLFTSRYLSWFLIDLLIALLSVAVSGVIWRSAGPLDLGLDIAFGIGLFIATLLSVFNFLLGLKHIEWSHARPEEGLLLLLSTSFTTGLIIIVNSFILPKPLLPNGLFFVSGILAFSGFGIARYRSRLITGLATFWIRLRGGVRPISERILIIGAGENGILCSLLFNRRDLATPFLHVIGFADDSPRKQGMKYHGGRVLGTTQDIPHLVQKYDIGVIVYSIENIVPSEQNRILEICRSTPARLVMLPNTLKMLRQQIGNAVSQRPESYLQDLPASPWAEQLDGWLELAENEKWELLKHKIQERRREL